MGSFEANYTEEELRKFTNVSAPSYGICATGSCEI